MVHQPYFPGFPLNQFVELFIYFEGIQHSHSVDRFLPNGDVEILVDFNDGPQYIYDNNSLKEIQACRHVWASGIRTEPITIPSGANAAMMVVAFKKGMAAQRSDAIWEVPYIPVDPADLGRTYDSVIRVNSQSGKGGIAYLLERDYGVVMPRRMQVEFSALVQKHMDSAEGEMSSQQLWALFEQTYLTIDYDVAYHAHHLFEDGDKQGIELGMTVAGERRKLRGIGSGPIAATVNALALPIRIDNYEERALRSGADASALAIVEAAREGVAGIRYGAGRHANIATASVLAVLSAARRLGVSAGDLSLKR
jgi:hypothetical protein